MLAQTQHDKLHILCIYSYSPIICTWSFSEISFEINTLINNVDNSIGSFSDAQKSSEPSFLKLRKQNIIIIYSIFSH